MDNEKKDPQPDDHLFQQAMDGVKPLKAHARMEPVKTRTVRAKPDHNQRNSMQDLSTVQFHEDLQGVDTDDGKSHRKNGVQKRVIEKLKRGRFKTGDQLDLHQMTTETGLLALLEFIEDSQTRSFKCVRIIHGKGLHSKQGPKLKLMTHQLLRNHPEILAFTACKPSDGGDVATDALLKT